MVITTKPSQTLSVRLKQNQNHTYSSGFHGRRSLYLHGGLCVTGPGFPFLLGVPGQATDRQTIPLCDLKTVNGWSHQYLGWPFYRLTELIPSAWWIMVPVRAQEVLDFSELVQMPSGKFAWKFWWHFKTVPLLLFTKGVIIKSGFFFLSI